MILAELETFHSRAVVPTRRVAVGKCRLPLDSPLRPGAVLVAGVVGRHLDGLDEDSLEDLPLLIGQIARGERIRQPRLRHRLQEDRIGLTRSRHRLLRRADGRPLFEFSDRGGSEAQYVLGAIYATKQLSWQERHDILGLVRRVLTWPGGSDGELLRFLDGHRAELPAVPRPHTWALAVLGLESLDGLATSDVQKRFRLMVASVHPDTGGADGEAGERISDLVEARRILLS
ncbi:MAG: hypothetical protein J4F99_02070 [Acidimicrobiia bacterium]|nr:hypothetical protein [Acidimicrobiia bacterium]